VEAAAARDASKRVTLGERQAIQCDPKTGSLDDVAYDDEHFVRDVRRPRPQAAPAAAKFAHGFDALDQLRVQQGYKCLDAKTSLSTTDKHGGTAAVRVDWRAAADNYGVVYLTRKVPATDVTGCKLEVWVKPLTASSGYWGVELFDDRGRLVEQHRLFELKVGSWNRVVFEQGKKPARGFLGTGPGDRRKVSKVVFRAQTRESGQSASDLWDDFQLIRPKG
jgi:hypothetical protein